MAEKDETETEDEKEVENADDNGSDETASDDASYEQSIFEAINALNGAVNELTQKLGKIESAQDELIKSSRIVENDEFNDVQNEDGLDDIKHLKDLDLVIKD